MSGGVSVARDRGEHGGGVNVDVRPDDKWVWNGTCRCYDEGEKQKGGGQGCGTHGAEEGRKQSGEGWRMGRHAGDDGVLLWGMNPERRGRRNVREHEAVGESGDWNWVGCSSDNDVRIKMKECVMIRSIVLRISV